MGFTNVPRVSIASGGVDANGLPYVQTAALPSGSRWGIDSTGAPYLNTAGVAAGDKASLILDPVTGSPYLER